MRRKGRFIICMIVALLMVLSMPAKYEVNAAETRVVKELDATKISQDNSYERIIFNEKNNGIYFLNTVGYAYSNMASYELVFYNIANNTYETELSVNNAGAVYYDNNVVCLVNVSSSAISETVGDVNYTRSYTLKITKYDLNTKQKSTTTISNVKSKLNYASFISAMGVDGQGRYYFATADKEILLYSNAGSFIGKCSYEGTIYQFYGFDNTNGNFYYGGQYNWVYWGYNHYMESLMAGNVSGSSISVIGKPITLINQRGYSDQERPSIMLDGRYLATTARFFGEYTYLLDSNSYNYTDNINLDTTINMDSSVSVTNVCVSDRSVVKMEVTTVANSVSPTEGPKLSLLKNGNSVLAQTTATTLKEYDIASGKLVVEANLTHPIYAFKVFGNKVVAVEKEDDSYYIETLDWTVPTDYIAVVPSTVKVGIGADISCYSNSAFEFTYTMTSSNPKIISVDEFGHLEAYANGSVTITIVANPGNIKKTFKVTASGANNTAVINTQTLDGATSNNIHKPSVSTYGYIVNAMLSQGTGGYYFRVEAIGNQVVVEKYDASYKLVSQKYIDNELPIVGGFYSGSQYNFIAFGQNNRDCSDDVEVIRIVKYDKNWNKLGSVSLSGQNTQYPFDAGSLSMTEANGSLYVHTCHQMYNGHQANWTMAITESDMQAYDSYCGVGNISDGYVSHSFHQFARTDGSKLYRVDLGDAYPRGIAYTETPFTNSVTNPDLYGTALSIPGQTGSNATYFSLGGFDLSDKYALITGNGRKLSTDTVRNIWIESVVKNNGKVNINWITSYTADDNITVQIPKLIKLKDNQFFIIWEEIDANKKYTTKMALISSDGNLASDIYSTKLPLSIVQPIVNNKGNVCWYYTNNGRPIFVEINPYNLKATDIVFVDSAVVSYDKVYVSEDIYNDEISLKKVASILPKNVDVIATNGEKVTLEIDGDWKPDVEKKRFYASISPDKVAATGKMQDKSYVLDRIEIAYSRDSYCTSGYIEGKPTPEAIRPEGKFVFETKSYLSNLIPSVYKIETNSDGSFSSALRFDPNDTSGKYNIEVNGYRTIFTVEKASASDSGEYVTLYIPSEENTSARYCYVGQKISTLDIRNVGYASNCYGPLTNVYISSDMDTVDGYNKVAAALPKYGYIVSDLGDEYTVSLKGEWSYDATNDEFVGTLDKSELSKYTGAILDPKNIDAKVTIKKAVNSTANSYTGGFNYNARRVGDKAIFTARPYYSYYDDIKVFQVTKKSDGTYSGRYRFGNKDASPEYDASASSSYYKYFNIDVAESDAGEYVTLFIYSSGSVNSKYGFIAGKTFNFEVRNTGIEKKPYGFAYIIDVAYDNDNNEYFETIATGLPRVGYVETDLGDIFEVKTTGAWTYDSAENKFKNTIDKSSYPANVTKNGSVSTEVYINIGYSPYSTNLTLEASKNTALISDEIEFKLSRYSYNYYGNKYFNKTWLCKAISGSNPSKTYSDKDSVYETTKSTDEYAYYKLPNMKTTDTGAYFGLVVNEDDGIASRACYATSLLNVSIKTSADISAVTGFVGTLNLSNYYTTSNDYLRKYAAALEKKAYIELETGEVVEVATAGAWTYDSANSCFKNKVDKSSITIKYTDSKGLLSKDVTIPVDIESGYVSRNTSLYFSPNYVDFHSDVTLSIYRYFTSFNASKVYRIKDAVNGSYTAGILYDSATADNIEFAENGYYIYYNMSDVSDSDNADYFAIIYDGTKKPNGNMGFITRQPVKLYIEHEQEKVIPAVPATCTEPGYTEKIICSGCGDVIKDSVKVDPIGHSWSEPVHEWSDDFSTVYAVFTCGHDNTHVDKVKLTISNSNVTPATCTTKGYATYTVAPYTHEGKQYPGINKSEPIAALGHDYSSKIVSSQTLKSPATDTSPAVYYYTCKRCGDIDKSKNANTFTDGPMIITAKDITILENATRVKAKFNVISADQTLEYSWWYQKDGEWKRIKNWTENYSTLTWNTKIFGDGIVLKAKARVAGYPDTEVEAEITINVHPCIKGNCQLPYGMIEPGEPGYLIGLETYPGTTDTVEMLILDCTSMQWVYTTGKNLVPENMLWTVWQPEYGYYWTLFRAYDEAGNLIDEVCYGFVNAY